MILLTILNQEADDACPGHFTCRMSCFLCSGADAAAGPGRRAVRSQRPNLLTADPVSMLVPFLDLESGHDGSFDRDLAFHCSRFTLEL